LEKHVLAITKTARYYTSTASKPRAICYALHGYGQLAPYFIRKFEALAREDILFVVPEGLHRFYVQGTDGRVGASWMTREERLDDIADYQGYLQKLQEQIEERYPVEKRFLLGFSQGVATACRWLTEARQPFQALINWAGAFPPDLDYQVAYRQLVDVPTYLVLGDADPYISEERFAEHLQFLHEQKITVKVRRFAGAHQIPAAPLADLMQELLPPRP